MVKIWAISDLHLSISKPEKNMGERFPAWKDYHTRISTEWTSKVKYNDIVLIPGDICWASKLSDAKRDLRFIDNLPGTKIISPGNHDFWWGSAVAMKKLQLHTIIFIKSGAKIININNCNVGIIASKYTDCEKVLSDSLQHVFDKDKYEKAKERLKNAVDSIKYESVDCRIAMLHYPTASNKCVDALTHEILTEGGVDVCLFGHIHDVDSKEFDNIKNKEIKYELVSADYLDFSPKGILDNKCGIIN
ncbi:MAG: metallophosphoesterase [Chlamydiia bacterium]|nr:metallophosphoesterase [Chlamydiia bacterium]